jgi:hypothetical protein
MGNKTLKFFAGGNHSFTGIVNHTGQDLRPGKNSVADSEAVSMSPWSHLFQLINVMH